MKKHTLSAQKRDLVGRKVKNLRKQGLVPASIYGKKIKSAAVSVKTDEFAKVYKEAGESGLIELSVGSDVRPVLIHNVQVDPIRGKPLHVEFYQVDLKEKVHAKVPVEFTGEPVAATNKIGVLLTITDEVEVEALPTDLPEKFTVDVSPLADIDAEIKVKELKALAGVTVLTDGELTLVKIGPLISKEAQAQAAAEAAAAAAAAAQATPAEGAAEGKEEVATEEKPTETPPAEKKEEEKKE
ncbi:50S ribosomal protein L25 [Candidatus Gottesmanbacteria bacterium]|nr:50S ribosomal protein L25 [Candidatus Gottesmanbacteria bacterium]